MNKICAIIMVLLVLLTGCNETDPKVQGARQIEKIEKELRERLLLEAKMALKEDKDFILDTTSSKICFYEPETKDLQSKELHRKIEKNFTGSFQNGIELYASWLPIHSTIYHVNKDNKDGIIAVDVNERQHYYSCDYVEVE